MHMLRSGYWMALWSMFAVVPCVAQEATPPDDGQRPQLLLQKGHGDKVGALACTPDGKYLASGGNDGIVKLWELRTGRVVLSMAPAGFDGRGVAISPDGATLAMYAASGQAIDLVEIPSGRSVKRLDGLKPGLFEAVFSPDGRFLAAGVRASRGGADETLVQIWDVEVGALAHSLSVSEQPDGAWMVRFSPDSRRIRAITHGGVVATWDVETGEMLSHFVSREDNGWWLAWAN